jgi:hypothetical protein
MAGTAQMPEITEQNEALKRENAQLYAQIKALSQRLAQGSAGESPIGIGMRFQTLFTSRAHPKTWTQLKHSYVDPSPCNISMCTPTHRGAPTHSTFLTRDECPMHCPTIVFCGQRYITSWALIRGIAPRPIEDLARSPSRRLVSDAEIRVESQVWDIPSNSSLACALSRPRCLS